MWVFPAKHTHQGDVSNVTNYQKKEEEGIYINNVELIYPC